MEKIKILKNKIKINPSLYTVHLSSSLSLKWTLWPRRAKFPWGLNKRFRTSKYTSSPSPVLRTWGDLATSVFFVPNAFPCGLFSFSFSSLLFFFFYYFDIHSKVFTEWLFSMEHCSRCKEWTGNARLSLALVEFTVILSLQTTANIYRVLAIWQVLF